MGEDPPLCCNCKGALCNPNILREVTDTAGRVDRVKGPVLLGCFFFCSAIYTGTGYLWVVEY
jgi:hypothetical protein